jgi:hypothetical protein
LITSAVVIAVGVLSYTSIIDHLIKNTPMNQIDQRAGQYFNKALGRAVYTYAVVRGINGIISVIQGTEVAVSPAGVGINMAVGEILDPVNDLVERFSWVMLVSSTSLGIQKILMEIGAWFGFKILLSFSMLVILAGIWIPRSFRMNLVSFGYKLILASIIIRFCIPAIAISSDRLYDLFLEKEYFESTKAIEKLKEEISDSEIISDGQKTDPAKNGALDKIKQMYKTTVDAMDIKGRIAALKDKAANYSKYTINLIIVFVLQTIIIPLIVFWALVKLLGFAGEKKITISLEEKFRELITGISQTPYSEKISGTGGTGDK